MSEDKDKTGNKEPSEQSSSEDRQAQSLERSERHVPQEGPSGAGVFLTVIGVGGLLVLLFFGLVAGICGGL